MASYIIRVTMERTRTPLAAVVLAAARGARNSEAAVRLQPSGTKDVEDLVVLQA